jgi:hypothetical protein
MSLLSLPLTASPIEGTSTGDSRAWRAQAALLGSFRFCANKRCRRHRLCCSDEPEVCRKRVWRIKKVVPKTLWNEWARINRLTAL